MVKSYGFTYYIFGGSKQFRCQFIRKYDGVFVSKYIVFVSFQQLKRKDVEIVLLCILAIGFNIFVIYRKRILSKPFGRCYGSSIFYFGEALFDGVT